MQKNNKVNNKKIGNYGENIACKYLLENGYEIIDKNFKTKFGEIDIIAKDGEEYVFLEVKTRRNLNYGNPIDAVTSRKQKKIRYVCNWYLVKKNLINNKIRFDIVEIYLRTRRIIHTMNVFF